MRVAIAAGGTGGHVYPAVAVAGALVARGDKVLWIGRPSSLEESEARALGVDYTAIPLQGLKRRLTWENVRALLRFVKGRSLARTALVQFQADVLFALGSYVSAPVISAALRIGLPVAVHEQNAVPGLVVSHYAKKVSRVLLTKPLLEGELAGKTQVVGMPLRPGIVLERQPQYYTGLGLDPARRTLFVFGGSQGALALCKAGLGLAEKWDKEHPDWQILLQTGVANLDWVSHQIHTRNVVPVGHLCEMGKAYACADVIVARSGAVSCAELEAVDKPVILAPYPHATRDHQRYNAEVFIREHANARLVTDSSLEAGALDASLAELMSTDALPRQDGGEDTPVRRIVDSLEEIARGGSQ